MACMENGCGACPPCFDMVVLSSFMPVSVPLTRNCPENDVNRKIAADIKEFDDLKSYLDGEKICGPFFSIEEINSVVDAIVKAVETQKLPSSAMDDLPKLKEINLPGRAL